MKELLLEIETYADEHNIPIIEKDSIAFIMKFIKLNDVKNVLEIGSAIGYASILMASTKPDIKITTIEHDETRYLECLKNVKKCGLEKQIDVVYQDALEVNLSGVEYDLIFIDAAKGQYEKFFEKFKYFLKPKGVIISDNMNFYGYAKENGNKANTKAMATIVEKIEEYKDYLNNNKEFITKYYEIGDGLAVSYRNINKQK